MELNNLNVDSSSTSWFLLTLFYKTERKYTCTKDKVLQLLTIMALDYAKNGDKLFSEEILKSDDCGAYIKELLWLSNCEYVGMDIKNDNKEYIYADLDDCKNNLVPFIYRSNFLDKEIKEKTIDVFRHFGAYPQHDLVTMISPILDKITNEDKTIDLTRVPSIVNKIDENNGIIVYLKQNRLNEENKNNKRLIKNKL